MGKDHRRRVFGPLLYGTLAIAGLLIGGLGLWWLWPGLMQSLEIRTYAAELRDPTPPSASVRRASSPRPGRRRSPGWSRPRGSEHTRPRMALGTLGVTLPVSRETIRTLVAGLKDDDPRARREAADALGRIGPGVVTAAEGLTEALKDEIRACAAWREPSGGSGERRANRLPGRSSA